MVPRSDPITADGRQASKPFALTRLLELCVVSPSFSPVPEAINRVKRRCMYDSQPINQSRPSIQAVKVLRVFLPPTHKLIAAENRPFTFPSPEPTLHPSPDPGLHLPFTRTKSTFPSPETQALHLPFTRTQTFPSPNPKSTFPSPEPGPSPKPRPFTFPSPEPRPFTFALIFKSVS
nr:vegetative cell wall protein gp1-like [Penaeus vannamei]